MKSKRTVGRHLRSISGLSEVLGDRLRSAALSPQMHFANNSPSNRDLRRDRPADLTDTSMVVPTFRVSEAARSLAQLGTPPSLGTVARESPACVDMRLFSVCRGRADRRHHITRCFSLTSHPTALELSQPCIGLPRLLSSQCHLSSLSLHRSDCRFGDPARRTHRR